MTTVFPAENTDDTRRRRVSYIIFPIVLVLLCESAARNYWPDLAFDHVLLETATTLIGVFVGLLALVRYYSKRESKILLIGTALLGAGFLDSIHGFTSSAAMTLHSHPDAPADVQWSFEISRVYLSVLFLMTWLDWRLKLSVHGLSKTGEFRVYLFVILLAVGCVVLFWQAHLAAVAGEDSIFNTLIVAVPGLLFSVTLIGYLIKGHWRTVDLEHWIVLFLITNVAAQAIFASASMQSSNNQVQLAHGLKVLSYLILLVGMLQSMYQTFRDAADTALKIAEANVALKLEAEERRRAQEKMIEARDRAEKSDQAKSDFLSSMSHELRTPLNSILGFGQLLATDPEIAGNNNKSESIDQILQAGRHLLELVNEVLDLSRIETGNMEILLVNMPVNENVKTCIALSQSLALQRGIRIESHCAETVGCLIRADLTRFRQVLLNLISNAIKYNRADGKLIITTSMVNSDMIRICVSDTGHGLNNDQVARIFEPFNRLGAANSQIEGTGIGLTITRRLVEMMNGTIGMESTVDEGSSFWVDLPAVTSLDNNREEATEGPLPAAEQTAAKLLYVEDNAANVHLMARLIERRGDLNLITATSAEAGLEVARTEKPDIVLVDIHLPGMNGFEVLTALRDQVETSSIPAIAVTASAASRDRTEAKRAGFNGCVTKPIEISKLYAEIDRLLLPEV